MDNREHKKSLVVSRRPDGWNDLHSLGWRSYRLESISRTDSGFLKANPKLGEAFCDHLKHLF